MIRVRIRSGVVSYAELVNIYAATRRDVCDREPFLGTEVVFEPRWGGSLVAMGVWKPRCYVAEVHN